MGIIRDTIKKFDDSTELANVQKEAVRALAALGHAKAETFQLEIEESLLSSGSDTNLFLPVSSILANKIVVRAYSSTGSNIPDAVGGILGKLIPGGTQDVKSGVTDLITNTLSIFLGEATASTATTEQYYIAVEGISFVRLDMKAWYMNSTAESIYQQMEKVVAVVAYKSVVDFNKIDVATFFALYESQLRTTEISPEEILQALENARKVYQEYLIQEPITLTKHSIMSEGNEEQ